MKGFWVGILLLVVTSEALAQDVVEEASMKHKGDIWITWGYNRSHYNPSDIHFQGEGFNFTLLNAQAIDDPEPFDSKIYFNPTRFTVPQFNFRAGYQIRPNLSISGGWDHMKYVLLQNQLVRIDGYIDSEASEDYAGKYDEQLIQVTPGFMKYEHTDGFNFVRLGVERFGSFWRSQKHRLGADYFGGVSAGLMFPWTDFTFGGTRYRNWIHLSGWAVSVQLGMRLEWLDCIFLQAQAQYGYASMGDIIIQGESQARASQNIVFFERSLCIGAYIPLTKK